MSALHQRGCIASKAAESTGFMSDTNTNNQNTPDTGGTRDWWTTWRSQIGKGPYFTVTLLGALVVALADQASKAWIVKVVRLPDLRRIDLTPVFDLTYVKNYGASFGMLAGGIVSRVILSLFAVAIIGVMVTWLSGVRRKLPAIGIAFIIGGALGNLIDRVLYGYVIDFIDFSKLFFPWVFNVADMAINVGVGCLILDAFSAEDDKITQSVGKES